MIGKAFSFWRVHGTRATMSKVSDVIGEQPVQKVYNYWRENGVDATVRRVGSVLLESIPGNVSKRPPESVEKLIKRKFPALERLPTHTVPRLRPRLNMVTDSINPPHLYGGVGTAIIFASLLAERAGCDLRIVTRTDQAKETNYRHILNLARVKPPANVEFAFTSYYEKDASLAMGEDEHFITTSWWTTWGTRQAVSPQRIIYLLQEDERMFYPFGDEYLRCSELLSDPDISFLVNTRILFDHLVSSGLSNVKRRGICFEPAFPASIFSPQKERGDRPYRFLFYARPNNVRNLFYRGVEALQAAVSAGVLDPQQWELYFVGKDIPRLEFWKGTEPERFENLSWQSYAALVRKMDLGLCLMYTPHPSYPPLDLAASGGVVVTNSFGGNKQNLDSYSQNIICSEPTVEGLLRGIERGVKLAKDSVERQKNYERNQLLRDWQSSFFSAIEHFKTRLAPKDAATRIGLT